MFGPNIGFLHLVVSNNITEDKTVFLRGPAVSILPVFIMGDNKMFLEVI